MWIVHSKYEVKKKNDTSNFFAVWTLEYGWNPPYCKSPFLQYGWSWSNKQGLNAALPSNFLLRRIIKTHFLHSRSVIWPDFDIKVVHVAIPKSAKRQVFICHSIGDDLINTRNHVDFWEIIWLSESHRSSSQRSEHPDMNSWTYMKDSWTGFERKSLYATFFFHFFFCKKPG